MDNKTQLNIQALPWYPHQDGEHGVIYTHVPPSKDEMIIDFENQWP